MNVEDYDLTRSEWEQLIREYIVGAHAERNRAILSRRLLDGICYEPLAEEFEMSVAQIQRIVSKEQQRLFRKIK